MLPQASHGVVLANLQLYHAISEMVHKARAKATTECEYKVTCNLLNGDISNDLE